MNKHPARDLFLILSRNGGMQTQRSINILQAINEPYLLVLDQPSPPRWHGITQSVAPGAWAASMMTLSQLELLPDRVWFIEDDVQLHLQEFNSLIEWTRDKAPAAYCTPELKTRESHPGWVWWKITSSPIGTFNQMCSVPKPMIEAILACERARFHEVWFPEMAAQTKTQFVCWRHNVTKSLFGPWQWRPALNAGPGLRHPVKVESEF